MRLLALSLLPLFWAPAAYAQEVPPDFEVVEVAGGFLDPVAIDFGPPGRTWIAEQQGRIWIIEGGARLPRPFLDLKDPVHCCGDRGMLGFAVHPDFERNGYVYVLYTVDPDEREPNDPYTSKTFGRLERWTADPDQGRRVALPGSRRVLIGAQPWEGFPNCDESHALGALRFGDDGTLLVSAGDGAHFRVVGSRDNVDAGGHDPECFGDEPGQPGFPLDQDVGAFRAQQLHSLAGKVLRLDPETGLGLPSNPYFDGDPASARSRVFMLGLRNPFRFAVRRGSGAQSPAAGDPGQLYIGDVGWDSYEEINVGRAGANFGWPCYEGVPRQPAYVAASGGACDRLFAGAHPYAPGVPANYVPPAVAWNHRDATAVTGTAFYTGHSFPPDYHGRLFQADMVRGFIRMFEVAPDGQLIAEHQPFVSEAVHPVELATDPVTGDLLYLALHRGSGQGRVMRIRYVGAVAPPPVAEIHAEPLEGEAPLTVRFDGTGSRDLGGEPLTWHWTFGDGATSEEPAPTHTYQAHGELTATLEVRNPDGRRGTARVTIVVHPPSEQPPEEPFFDHGTQPGELTVPLASVETCAGCHAGYEEQVTVSPGDTWSGSMMANSMRDPLFLAALTLANQDHPDAGSFCMRCHAPAGWLDGRSLPGDGSALLPEHREGITCAFCHRLEPGLDRDPAGPLIGNGRYYLRDEARYNTTRPDGRPRHPSVQSEYLADSASCGVCHSVTGPAGPDGEPGGGAPEQRTYEEWEASAFAAEGIHCQDCHMPRAAGFLAGDGTAVLRPDAALHDFAGANVWGPRLLDAAYPGERPEAYARASRRAEEMLQDESAAVTVDLPDRIEAGRPIDLSVRVENLTGHKLPTGYADGRRMWIQVEAAAPGAAPWFTSGAYDHARARLVADPQLRIYQAKLGEGAAHTFHLLRADRLLEDTRIPPRGFAPDAGPLLPIGRDYRAPDGSWRHWDDAPYAIPAPPPGTVTARFTVRLLYQTTTAEFVEHLRDANHTDDTGQRLYDLWVQTDRATPVVMAELVIDRSICNPGGRPSAERCDGFDNDCDGQVDEAWPLLGEPCSVGTGACRASGRFVCGEDGAICDAVPGAPLAENCGNEIDDDCDGQVDEGCDAPEPDAAPPSPDAAPAPDAAAPDAAPAPDAGPAPDAAPAPDPAPDAAHDRDAAPRDAHPADAGPVLGDAAPSVDIEAGTQSDPVTPRPSDGPINPSIGPGESCTCSAGTRGPAGLLLALLVVAGACRRRRPAPPSITHRARHLHRE